MSDLKHFLRDLGYFGVGAAAVIVETGAKAVKGLVRKGEKTLRDNQDTVDELKRRAREAGERIKDAMEKVSSQPEEPIIDAPDAVEGPVAPDVIYRTDEPVPQEELVVEEPTVEVPVVEEPAVEEPFLQPEPETPLAVESPEEAEKPEETING